MQWIGGMIMNVALCSVGCVVKAQSIDAMLEQIAALKEFAATAEKGYQIVEGGLHSIRDIKDGEFNLHSLFFASLSSVNPSIRDMPQVEEIISLEAAIVKQFSDALAGYKQTGMFSTAEIAYMQGVYEKLVGLGTEHINALESLLAEGSLKMADGERIRRIGVIEGVMRDEYEFTQAFTQSASLLLVQRQQEMSGIGVLKLTMPK